MATAHKVWATFLPSAVRKATATMLFAKFWPFPFQRPQNLCRTAPYLIQEHYTACLCLRLFIAHHLQPGKLTFRFETLELRLDPEDNLTRQLTEGASAEKQQGWYWSERLRTRERLGCNKYIEERVNIEMKTIYSYFKKSKPP